MKALAPLLSLLFAPVHCISPWPNNIGSALILFANVIYIYMYIGNTCHIHPNLLDLHLRAAILARKAEHLVIGRNGSHPGLHDDCWSDQNGRKQQNDGSVGRGGR